MDRISRISHKFLFHPGDLQYRKELTITFLVAVLELFVVIQRLSQKRMETW
jgi:hypothetical protein